MGLLDWLYYEAVHGTTRQQREEARREREVRAQEKIAAAAERDKNDYNS